MTPKARKIVFGSGFSFVTGFVDILCIVRYNAFGTMMTGNLLNAAKFLLENGSSSALPSPWFFLIIILWRNAGLLLYRVTKSAIVCVSVVMLLVCGSCYYQYYQDPEFSEDGPVYPERWNVWFVALGFGVQSAVTFPHLGVPTMLATGHMTSVWDAYMGKCLEGKGDLEKTHVPICIVLAMVCGMLSGAFINKHFVGPERHLLLIPLIVFQGTLLVMIEHLSKNTTAAPKEVASPAAAPYQKMLDEETPQAIVGRWRSEYGEYDIMKRNGQFYFFEKDGVEGVLVQGPEWLEGDVNIGRIRIKLQGPNGFRTVSNFKPKSRDTWLAEIPATKAIGTEHGA